MRISSHQLVGDDKKVMLSHILHVFVILPSPDEDLLPETHVIVGVDI